MVSTPISSAALTPASVFPRRCAVLGRNDAAEPRSGDVQGASTPKGKIFDWCPMT
jgi:hypothetical protein